MLVNSAGDCTNKARVQRLMRIHQTQARVNFVKEQQSNFFEESQQTTVSLKTKNFT